MLRPAKSSFLRQSTSFNAASKGALVLGGPPRQGDFFQESFFKRIGNLVRPRNAYGNADVSILNLAQDIHNSVKVNRLGGPVQYKVSDYTRMLENPELAGATIGKQLGEDQLADMLNTAVAACAGAIVNGGTSVTHTATSATATLAGLQTAAAKFGDAAQAIRAWIVHSKVWNDLVLAGLTNTERLFTYEGVNIMQDAAGRPFIITDSPALVVTDGVSAGVDAYRTLGLVEGSATATDNNDFTQAFVNQVGKENLSVIWQGEWSYNLGLKGYTWDIANGGKSPNNAALALGTNWDKVVDSIKNTAGVALVTR